MIFAYGGPGANVEGTVEVEADGAVLHFEGNLMQTISVLRTATENTVLEFDFRSTVEGEIHGFGTNLHSQVLGHAGTFVIHGTQPTPAFTNLTDYAPSAPDYLHYSIRLGDYATGDFNRIWFVNDHDIPNPDGNSYFANLRLIEVAGAEGEPAAASAPSGLLLPKSADEKSHIRFPNEPSDQPAVPVSNALSESAIDMVLTGLIPPSPAAVAAATDDLFGHDDDLELEDLLEEE